MTKRNFFLLLAVLTLFLIGTYIQATVYNTPVTITGPLDASGSTHTLGFKVVASTGSLPSSGCTAGEMAVVTGATLGQQIYQNSGSGTCVWTQQLNSGTATGGGITMYSATGLTVTANTYYIPLGGGGSISTTEANVDIDSPSAATVTNMYVQLSVALGMGNSGVFTMRKNGSSQSITCTISGAVTTSCSDTTHSFAVSQGDLLTIQLVTTGTIVVTPNILIASQFGNITATGTVNTGTINQIAYYAAGGTAVSGETQIGNGNYYGVVATAYVATQQSTTSLTDVDLTTPDTVTFTLAATSNILIQYTAQTFNSNAGKGCTSEFYFDTVDASIYANQQQGATGSTPQAVTGQYVKTGVAAGSHTVNVKHRVEVNTCNWLFRNISVFTTP